MSELFQYSLGDLLLFSEATYFELLSYYHHAIWPSQVVATILSMVCCWLLYKRGLWYERIVLTLFAVSWFWLGLVFQGTYYSDINWLVEVFEGLFCLQGALLLSLTFWRPRQWDFDLHVKKGANFGSPTKKHSDNSGDNIPASLAGLSIIVGVTLLLPLLPLLLKISGRSWDHLEIIFFTPDATSVATLGLLWAIKPSLTSRIFGLLILVPLLWCLFSLLTWLAMASVGGG